MDYKKFMDKLTERVGREDDEYHNGPDPVKHTYNFKVSKDGAEPHHRSVTTPMTRKPKHELEHLARAHLEKQGYKIHESVNEEHLVHVNDGSNYGDKPHPKDVEHVMAGAKKHNGEHDGNSDKGAFFKFKSHSDAKNFATHVGRAPHKSVYADLHEGLDIISRADYKLDKAGKKSHKEIVFHNGDSSQEKDDKLKREHIELEEKLDPSMGAGEYIKDFQKSDAPQFKGKSKEKKRMMGIAAYMSAKKSMKEEVHINEYKNHAAEYDKHMNNHYGAAEKGEWDKAEAHAKKAEAAATSHFKTTGKKIYDPGYSHSHPHITSSPVRKEEAMNDNLHPAGAALLKHIKPEHHNKYKAYLTTDVFNGSHKDRTDVLNAAKKAGHLKEAKNETPPFDGPYTKSPGTVKDKSGAVHTPMSRVKHLARQAMKQKMKEDIDLFFEAKDEEEYGYEGDMAMNQLETAIRHATYLKDMMEPDTDLPEWVQSKITLATDYLQTACDYMTSEMNEALKGGQKNLDKNKNGKLDAQDFKLLRKEEQEITEATVDTKKYSWGTMKTVHHGSSFSIPLHPEHHQAIAKLKDQQEHKFKDETGRHWTAKRSGSDVHFQGANGGSSTKVPHKSIAEQVELEEAMINGREYASHGLMHPTHAAHAVHKVTGNTVDFYAHGSGDKVSGKVTKNDGKAVHIKDTSGKTHQFKVTPHLPKQQNEELDMVDEQAPVAPVPDRKYIKGTPENKALKASRKPMTGHPTKVKEGTNFDEEGTLMAEKKTYSQFVEQLLEYESDSSGKYVHTKGSYGKSYDSEDDDKPSKAEPSTVKRGRGRPAGAKSGANQKVSSGKSYGGIATHTLNLPK